MSETHVYDPTGKLSDRGEALNGLIDFVREKLTEPPSVPVDGPDAVAASVALFRQIVVQASAIAGLSRSDHAEACSANLRTMFEAWAELRYVLETGNRQDNGFRYSVFGLLEWLDYLEQAHADERGVASIRAKLEWYRSRNADLVASVEAGRRKKNPDRFWSGMGRVKLLQELELLDRGTDAGTKSGSLTRLYKMMSWDAHCIVNVALEVTFRTRADGYDIELSPRQDAHDAGIVARGTAATILADAWDRLAGAFGWPSK